MKLSMVVASTVAIVLGVTLVAGAGQQQTDEVDLEQAWVAWFLGSASANPLRALDGFCGETVGDQFFLMPGVTAPTVERTCEIPSGVEIVISPIGGFSNTPTDGNTDIKLFSAALGYFQGVVPQAVKATVDGVLVPKGPASCIDPFDISVERHSFLDDVDKNVTTDVARIANCSWFYVLPSLAAGEHTLVFKDKWKDTKRGTLVVTATVP